MPACNENEEDIKILFEDEFFMAASKPPFWETISNKGGDHSFGEYLKNKRQESYLNPIHRLDRDTSGVLLLAKSKKVEEDFILMFQKHLVQKTYLAFCCGFPSSKTGSIRKNLYPWKSGEKFPVKVAPRDAGLSAKTNYTLLSVQSVEGISKKISALSFFPEEGRTHQIRVHAASSGLPILGDDVYGDRSVNKEIKKITQLARQALHAYKIEFMHPISKRKVSITAPLPSDLLKVKEQLFLNLSMD